MWKARALVALAVVVLPGVMLAPAWRLAGLGAGEDDILYYFPMRTFFHDTVRNGDWPWLNPWTGLGRPFLADPQTAVWYPFTWLFAALRPLHAYPICLWAHYSLALWGAYRLLRAGALDRRAALFGGIAFAFSGFLLAHRAHLTMQHAAAWTPWVLWRFERHACGQPARSAARSRSRRPRLLRSEGFRLAAAAAALAMQFLAGHAQIAALTAVAALIVVLARGSRGALPGGKRAGAVPAARAASWAATRAVLRWLTACLLAVGLCAAQWLPTWEYVRLCTRVERTYADFVENSWYPVSAVGWLLPMLLGQRTPNFFGQPYWGPSHQVEQFSYAGLIPLMLAVAALRRGWCSDPRRRVWIAVGLFGLLLALGQFGPICPLLYWVPGSRLFRCPARALVLVNLALAALAAATLDDLGVKLSPQRARVRAALLRWTARPALLTGMLIAVPLVLVALALPALDENTRSVALRALRPWNSTVWVPLVTAGAAIYAVRFAVRRWKRPHLLALPMVVTVLDLGVIGWTLDVPAGDQVAQALVDPRTPGDWVEQVRESPHRLWVVTGRVGRLPGEYVRPLEKAVANTNILHGIRTLTDYGPLQPRAFVSRFGFAPWGETSLASSLLGDTRWTRAYNVGWILLCDEGWPTPADCELAATTAAGWRLYRSVSAAGYAFLEDPSQPGAVQWTERTPSAFTLRADTWPATASRRPRAVVSMLALPGWTARSGGEPVTIEVAPGGLMAVALPPGQPVEIEFSYFPPGLLIGAGIAALSGIVLVACVAWRPARGV